jgi:predicted RNA-binding Zn ribbon-like protein
MAEKYEYIANNLSLDFVNSVSGRKGLNGEDPLDYKVLNDKLEDYSDLVDWAHKAGIIDDTAAEKLNRLGRKDQKASQKVYKKALVIREAVYRIFISLVKGEEPDSKDVALLNRECIAAREHQELHFDSGHFRWDLEIQSEEPEGIIRQIALSAAELLTSGSLHRVKECSGDNCGWLFLDTSKNGSRQWCSMKDCGNLAKVRKFREKNH